MKTASFKKTLALFLVFGLVVVSGLSAQTANSDSFGIGERVQVLIDVISSPWVKGIAVIALVIECIILITSGASNQGIVKKFVPWIIGTILFMAAGSITKQFVKPDEASFQDIMGRYHSADTTDSYLFAIPDMV